MRVDRKMTTDVLVVGGSGAAIMSAISAKKNGAKVLMVSKGKIGRSGNAIMIGGGFGVDGVSAQNLCDEEADTNYTKESVYNKIQVSGFGLSDQKIGRQFVEVSPCAVEEFFSWEKDKKRNYAYNKYSHMWITAGRVLGSTLKSGFNLHKEIDVMEDTICVDLLKSGEEVCGAIVVNVYSGEIIEVKSKSVIMASGGFQPFSLKNSISDMTGDGIAMALRAGARAKDMEFLLFIPTIVKPDRFKGSILPYLFTMPGFLEAKVKITDCDGELIEIEDKYKSIPPNNKMAKLVYAYTYGKRMFEKADKYRLQMYYDFSDNTEEYLREAFVGLANKFSVWHRKGHYNGLNLSDVAEYIIQNDMKLEVGLGNEYSMGGIIVDDKMKTDVKGLYAAGEVTAGLFGAFRSADGIVEMLAHGVTAGESAAEHVKDMNDILESDNKKALLDDLLSVFDEENGDSPLIRLKKIESNNDYGFNFFRTGEKLTKSKRVIDMLIDKPMAVSYKGRKYNNEWISSILAKNLALVSKLGIEAAILRPESRGTHMRYDCPMVDNENQTHNIVFWLENGSIKQAFEKPVVVDFDLQTLNYDCLLDYILDSIE